jgi:ABC-2 type transport system ATP-binding protein
MTQPPFIQVVNVSKLFGKNIVLDGLNLDIGYGEIYGVIGKSGSGKTTLLNCLIGFLKPDKGSVLFQSRDIKKDVTNVNMQFGFSAQESSLYDKLTVDENLKYFGSLYKLDKVTIKEKIEQLLKFIGLEGQNSSLTGKLSTGMKKRLDIACALIHDPKILILDEPTADLDPSLRKEVMNLLKKISKEKNVTIIITSHLLGELEICDKIAILHNRKIAVQGSTTELKEKYSKNIEIVLETTSGNYTWLEKSFKTHQDVEKTLTRDGKLVLYTSNPEVVLKEILKALEGRRDKMLDLDVNKPSLNEVFEYFTQKKEDKKEEIKK